MSHARHRENEMVNEFGQASQVRFSFSWILNAGERKQNDEPAQQVTPIVVVVIVEKT